MSDTDPGVTRPQDHAAAAELAKAIANTSRLVLLTTLQRHGELRAGDLVEAAGLSQSATSQHLATLRDAGLVSTRRDAQAIYYRVSDRPEAKRALDAIAALTPR